MAYLKSKGCSLLIDISSTMTAIPQLTSINISGEQSETMETSTLDTSGQHKTYAPNGWTETAEVTADGLYDPDNAVHTQIETLAGTSVATDIRVDYTDTTPTQDTYSAVSFGMDKTISNADPVGMSITMKTSGAPS